jgi:hypothetical protein
MLNIELIPLKEIRLAELRAGLILEPAGVNLTWRHDPDLAPTNATSASCQGQNGLPSIWLFSVEVCQTKTGAR